MQIYVRNSLCSTGKNGNKNLLGPEERLSPGASPAGYPARRVYVYVIFSPLMRIKIRAPPPTPELLTKDSLSATRSRMEIPTKNQVSLVRTFLDDPRASYRAENPTNPKLGQKYQPDIQIPRTAGDRKSTPKIPEKYPENTNFVFF